MKRKKKKPLTPYQHLMIAYQKQRDAVREACRTRSATVYYSDQKNMVRDIRVANDCGFDVIVKIRNYDDGNIEFEYRKKIEITDWY